MIGKPLYGSRLDRISPRLRSALIFLFVLSITGTLTGTATSSDYTLTNQQPNTMVPYAANPKCLSCKQLPNAGNGGPTQLYSGSAAAITGLLANDNSSPMQFHGPYLSNQPGSFYYASGNTSTDSTYWSNQNTPINVKFWSTNRFAIGPSAWDAYFNVWDQKQGIMVSCAESCTGSTTNPYCGYNNVMPTGGTSLTNPATISLQNCSAQRPFAGANTDKDHGWGANETYSYNGNTMGGQYSVGFAAWATVMRLQEFQSGQVLHANGAGYSCSDDNLPEGGNVYPATYKLMNGTNCPSKAEAGMLVFADYTDSQISNMAITQAQKNGLWQLAHFGTYLIVTNGHPNVGYADGQFKAVANDQAEGSEAWNTAAGYVAACNTTSSSFNANTCDTKTNPNFYNWLFPQTGNSESFSLFNGIPSIGCGGISCHLHVASPCVAEGMAGDTGAVLGCSGGPVVGALWVHVTGSGTISAGSYNLVYHTDGTGDKFYNMSATNGTSVTLTVSPSSGSSFGGWSGACSGTGTCTLSLDGTKGVLAVTATFNSGGGSSSPAVSISPPSLTWGSQLVGSTGTVLYATVSNTGNATLDLTSHTVSGDFYLAGLGTCGASLAAGASCTYSVGFKPAAAGTRAGSLTITDNASNSPQTVPLSGVGLSSVAAPAAPVNILISR